MFCLQSLRNAPRLARFVLVWFALFVGVAVASPLVKPEASQLVCTAIGGMKLVQLDASGDDAAGPVMTHTVLDCPACLPLIAPPAAQALTPLPAGNLSYLLQSLQAARLTSVLGQPWQARAPPSSFA
jgi:hypothetical protein